LLAGPAAEVAARFSDSDAAALRAYVAEARRLTVPAEPTSIVAHVERLGLHYPQPRLEPAHHALRWDDWLEDLADVPEDVLIAACRIWRRSNERFAPSPGQLLAQVGGRRHWGLTRQIFLRRALEVQALLAPPAMGAKHPSPDHEAARVVH
jgi:hypothetical protein